MSENLEIWLRYEGEEKYSLSFSPDGNNTLTCYLPFSKHKFYEEITYVNSVLNNITTNQAYIRKEGIDHKISEEIYEQHLSDLVNLGNRLWRFLFGKGQTLDQKVIDCEKALNRLSQQQELNIKIVSLGEDGTFMFPWALLYNEEEKEKRDSNDVDKDLPPFWGFKHIIQNKPCAQFVTDEFSSSPLQLSFNYHESAYVRPVEKHKNFFQYFQERNKLTVVPRTTSKQVLDAFKQDLDESIVYFFCHGKSFNPEIGEMSDKSYLELTGGGQLSLELLRSKAPDNGTFRKNPLVFLNACETAVIYPIFATGFLQYFLVKGARAVIGTLTQVPAAFATEFATKFFEEYFMGQKNIDRIIYELRRGFLEQERNLLGLCYLSYSHHMHLDKPILKPEELPYLRAYPAISYRNAK